MMRDKIGGWPYDITKNGGNTVIHFYPKGDKLKHPDAPKFTLSLDKEDIKKLAKLG